MRLNELNETAEEFAPGATRYRAALISLHGMRTTGKWQKDLVPDVQDKAIRYMLVDYDYLVFGVVVKRRRRGIIKDLLLAYREQRRHAKKIAAVAHSFGTLTLMQAIFERKGLRFARVILYGCIVHRRYPWQVVHAAGRIDRVLHETSKSDRLPRLAPFLIPNSGASGCKGFKDCPPYVEEREYGETGHSGLQYRKHYRCVWIPFILS